MSETLIRFNTFGSSFHQPVSHNAPKRLQSVAPADLFPLLVSTTRIADRQLVNSAIQPGDFCGHFRLDAETVLIQRRKNLLNDLFAKNLVAGFHIGQVQVGEAVREVREKSVSQIMPEVQNAMRLVSQKATAVNHVGFAFDNRLQ